MLKFSELVILLIEKEILEKLKNKNLINNFTSQKVRKQILNKKQKSLINII